jgi:hypothetical protein
MKNIHILPTDKPSRLWKNNLLQGKLELSKEILIGSNTAQHIYITSNNDNDISDEGINHATGSLVLNTITNKVYKTLVNIISGDDIQKIILTTDQDLISDGVQSIDDEFLEWFVNNTSCESVEVKKENQFFRSGPLDLLGYSVVSYKIIIPEKITRCCGRCNGIDDLCYTDMTCDNHNERGCETCYGKRVEYKIAIPQEEPKQCPKTFKELFANTDIKSTTDESGNTHYNFKATMKEEPKQDRTCTNSCSVVCGECQILEPKQTYNNLNYGGGFTEEDIKRVSDKQETLEETVLKSMKSTDDILEEIGVEEGVDYRDFKTEEFEKREAIRWAEFGAKWQAERMYSEEEVLKLLEKYAKDISELNMKTPIWDRPVFEKAIYWFEHFINNHYDTTNR